MWTHSAGFLKSTPETYPEMQSGLSWALGALDKGYYVARVIQWRPRFFADGWGNVEAAEAAQFELCQQFKPEPPALEWEKPRGNLCVASFESPMAHRLPEEARLASFHFVSPERSDIALVEPWNSEPTAPTAIVLLMPATAEETPDGRIALAQKLAEDGVCSLILGAPFYGKRKPTNQQMHYIRTVEMFLDQSTAIVAEAASLMCWCASRWPGVPICVSGFSWGGAMTCVSSIVASQLAPSAQIVAVPYAGSATPAVLVDGLLQDDIQWSALGESADFDKTRDRLMNVLLQTHLSKIVENVEGKPQLAGLHVVNFENDGFVKAEYGEELYTIMSTCCKPDATRVFRWQSGGHVYAFLARQQLQVDAIQQACKACRGLAARL